MGNIQRLRSIAIRTKWKTITAILIVALASFSIGAFANQVVVQQVQSIGGKHVLVPAPELQINSTTWNINGTSSMITGVTLHVITVGGPSGVTKLYQIFVQVSCLNALNVSFTCATGNGTIILPANGGSGTLLVPVSPQIDPELTEVDDLSFIVTGSPAPNCPPGTTPGFTLIATPTAAFLNRSISSVATVTKTLTSTCGFSGTVSFTASSSPAGLTIAFSASTVTLPANGAATVTEAIAVSPTTPNGNYTITNTATSGTTTHSVTITLDVV